MREFTAVVVLVAGLAGIGLRAEVIEQILVKVNGEILTKTELEKLQIAALRERPNASPAAMGDTELGKALAEITPAVIIDAVDELLLLQRAKALGYGVTDEGVNSVLESIKKDNKIESEAAFQAALKQEGFTLPQLREMLTKRMLLGQVQQREVMRHIDVTEAQMKAYYDAHTSEFASTPSVTLREIMISVPTDPKGVNAAASEEAQQKADAIRTRVVEGEAFEKVAGEASDAPSKANGGLIGPILMTELTEDLSKTLSAMKAGDVTPVLRVPNGYEILKLESAVESTTLPFDQAKNQIADRLGVERQGTEMQKYLKKLRAQAIIEWKNDEVRKAYKAGLAARDKQGN